jgi:hypothetical protein
MQQDARSPGEQAHRPGLPLRSGRLSWIPRRLRVQDVIDQLSQHYGITNRQKFDGILPERYHICFNPYLRRLTGRITYGFKLIEISL